MSRTKTIRIVKEITFDIDKLKSAYHDVFHSDIADALRGNDPELLKQLARDLESRDLAVKTVISTAMKAEMIADRSPSGPGD